MKKLEIALDIVSLTGLAQELTTLLAGCRLKVLRHVKRSMCLLDAGQDRAVIVDLTPGRGHIRPPGGWDERDWMPWGGHRTESAEVLGVSVAGGDRVLELDLHWHTRLGDDLRSRLVLELGGKQTNAMILSEENRLVEVLRPVSGKVNRVREILPMRPYVPPPTFNRFAADSAWNWPEDAAGEVEKFLRMNVLSMSGWLAREICHRADIVPDTDVADLSCEERSRMETVCEQMISEAEPWVVDGGTYLGYRPTGIPNEELERTDTFAAAAGIVWDERLKREKEGQKLHGEFLKLQSEQKKLRTLRKNLLGDLKEVARADELTRLADLLMAHNSHVKPGEREIELVDWFDPDHPTLVVRLDGQRTPIQHAERLYQRARKLRESEPRIRLRLKKTEKRLAAIQEKIDEYSRLDFSGIEKKKMEEKKHEEKELRTASGQRVAPRRYRTRDGNWLVLVGRNDEENDFLSLKIAAQNDYWFHAQGCPGSHVVLKVEGRKENPSRRALAETAAVAAYWSKSRGSSKVPVHYTFARYVNKKKGAKPGSVMIRREKLLMVPPALLPMADAVDESL